IGELAFYDCYRLTSVTIPQSVTQIGKEALGYTYGVKVDGFTICAKKGTAAEKYAKDNGFKFVEIKLPKATRLAGAGRYATAVEISKAGFPDGSDTVVLAYGLNYADALAGVPLAKAMNAPILLTTLKTLPAETLAEIERLNAKKVIILGGTSAVSADVEKALTDKKLEVERIAGTTRFETAAKIADKMQQQNENKAPTDVFFVYYNGFADALSVSAAAAVKGAPIVYLTTNGALNPDTAAYLADLKKAGSVKNAYVIGGTSVISDDMATKAANALGLAKATRVAGANRFETCVAVNEKFADVLGGDMLCVATGMDFPDALAGGVYAALNKAPLFLINGKLKTSNLNDKQKAYLIEKKPSSITAFGGTSVVPDGHIEDIAKNSI
ncbi:MAG: cell wall-binding repeat-containing protein, partial [Ruminococcus sp.]|nr:cell wall-binding repeat-containing protein [Ruminococcus sp.]